MKLHSNSVKNGFLDDRFGHRGNEIYKGTMPTRSFHLAWEDLPANTQSLALVFIDYDAIPPCGFPFIHWTVTNIDPSKGELTENESAEGDLLEGVSSWVSRFLPDDLRLSHEEATAFGGCAPPDKPHEYTVEVYALDTRLDLKKGFYLNEMMHQMKGHILDQATLDMTYKNKEEN